MPSERALRVIMRGEIGLGAAERLGDDDGGIIGRARDHAEDRILDADRRSGAQAELGRRLGRSEGRDGERGCRG